MGKIFRHSREIPATPAQVFAAFNDPARLARWWGPAGFTNTFELCEFKKGGRWKFVMHGPDGKDYKNESVFAEVDPARVIVIEHITGPNYRLTIELTPTAKGTTVFWVQVFEDEAVANRIAHIVTAGNEENLDRLAREVVRAS